MDNVISIDVHACNTPEISVNALSNGVYVAVIDLGPPRMEVCLFANKERMQEIITQLQFALDEADGTLDAMADEYDRDADIEAATDELETLESLEEEV